MTVYKISFDRENFLSVNIEIDELFEKMGEDFLFLNGTKRSKEWQAVAADFYSFNGNDKSCFMPDISDWLGNMVLSQKAYVALKDNLDKFGEFLEININNEHWYIYNVTSISNAVDESLSKHTVMNGEVSSVEKIIINENDLNAPIFKIDYDELVSTFCTDDFKNLVLNNQLKGIKFKLDLTSF